YVDYAPVCPEVEAGLGLPREPIHLVQLSLDGPPRVRGVRSEHDWTDTLEGWADGRLPGLAAQRLRGYIFKSGSPSCGLFRQKVYLPNGMPRTTGPEGQGLFARRMSEAFPNLPMEDEGRLQDARLRENFLTRVFVYDRWLTLREAPTPGGLVRFHSEHKILVLAHDPATYRALGPLVAGAGRDALEPLLDAYERKLMLALRRPASRKRNLNAMQHLCGFLKGLSATARQELDTQLVAYRTGVVPHEVPMALLRHHLRQTGHPWAMAQRYLEPTPPALGLRATL
ncbi:MAG: DUF1722 domain-containing protein, partial [Myxococcales bacterium]|nr:DUF1722 domain-containing protein [Myxococcales bacterium]